MSIVLGEEQRKRTLVPAPPAYTTKPSTRRLAYTMSTRKLSARKLSARKLSSKSQSRRSLSNGASSRHLNRKDTEVSVISVEARRSQLEIMAAATGINSNNTDMDGQESSLHLSEEALESMRRDYVRKLSLEILSSTTHDTRTELHCDVLLELLKDDAFFKDLSDSVRRELCRVMGYKNLAPDMAVFRRGDPGDNFYVILSGSVAVYADEIEGMPLAELREGQGFGEMALAHDAPRNATIVTRDQTELLFIPKNEYRSILRKLQFKEYNEKTSCFKSLPHFRHWDNYALMGLSKVCKLITEPANKLMCRQGDVVSHIYIVKKGRCRLIKEIAVPRIKCRLGESQTADRLIGKRDCLVDAETLEGGSFFGENGVLVLDKATQPPPSAASPVIPATIVDAASHDSSSEATAALGAQASSSASASTQRIKVAEAAILSSNSESESDSSESDDGNDDDVNQDNRVSKSKPIATNSGKRPRRPSQILKAAIPELYPASMVTDCETQFLVVRLVDFLRCCTTTDHDELLQFAAYRVHSLHHKTVQKRLANQIRWEREKRNVLLTAKIPKYSRALQLHRPHHQQHSIEELHDHPFRC